MFYIIFYVYALLIFQEDLKSVKKTDKSKGRGRKKLEPELPTMERAATAAGFKDAQKFYSVS